MISIAQLRNVCQSGILVSLVTTSFYVQAQASAPVSAESNGANVNNTQQPMLGFPQWSERKKARREIIPPPPPGPYMSTALSSGSKGYSKSVPSFGNQSRVPIKSSSMKMESFSPDIPWPTNLRPPTRWVPDSGYQYVAPQAQPQLRPVAPPASRYNAPTGGQFSYQRGPQMNMPRMGGSNMPGWNQTGINQSRPNNWMPSMNTGQLKPYPNRTQPNQSFPNRSNAYPPNQGPYEQSN